MYKHVLLITSLIFKRLKLKHVKDVENRSSTPRGCNAMYVEDIKDCKNLQYTQDLMLWFEKQCVSAFQNFFRIENLSNIKEVMSKSISDNNNAAMLLMAHGGDVGDVKYLNKRSKATLYRAVLLMLEMSEIFELDCVSQFKLFELRNTLN